jgi:hypothetical protein
MVYKTITRCPVCSAKLRIQRLKCRKCGTTVENEFEFSKFSYFDNEQLNFIETFLICRGNIKDVEKKLGISYPTVRAKLDDIIEALGYKEDITDSNVTNSKENNKILDMLESGEITAEQALNLLKE